MQQIRRKCILLLILCIVINKIQYWYNQCTIITYVFTIFILHNKYCNVKTPMWRRLHNEELNDLYSSPNTIRVIKSRRMRWAGHVACMGEKRVAYRILVGRPEGRRSLGRPRRRWEDNIKMDIREVGWEDMNWIELAQDRDRWRALANAVMNLRVP
jgi:hypothetical protein